MAVHHVNDVNYVTAPPLEQEASFSAPNIK